MKKNFKIVFSRRKKHIMGELMIFLSSSEQNWSTVYCTLRATLPRLHKKP